MRFNLNSGLASQKKLSASSVEHPRINKRYTGSMAKVTGIVKFDLHMRSETGKGNLKVGGNIQGIFDLGVGRFGSEAIFVPRQPGTTSEEDDGYLIYFEYDENTGKSAVNIIDAKTMSPDTIAVVQLPRRVPYGFHAFFVTELEDIR